MKLQQWGTFSVRDHLRPRAFVAEVLLYDKLVIPRPPTPEESQAEPAALANPNSARPAHDPKDRWRLHGWDPDRQRELLDILEEFDLAVELPWGQEVEQDWDALYDPSSTQPLDVPRSDLRQSIQQQIEGAKIGIPDDAPFLATGGVLSLYVANELKNRVARKLVALAKTPGIPVEPVIAYGSYAEFSTDQGMIAAPGEIQPPEATPYALFGWEFFVPEDSSKTDAELLRHAAKLASRPDFCENRQYFHGWLKEMVEGQVDPQDARENMLKMLKEYTQMTRLSGMKTAVRYAAKAASVFAPLLGLHAHTAGVEAGVGASVASLGLEWLLPATPVPDRLRAASVLYDAKRFFRKSS